MAYSIRDNMCVISFDNSISQSNFEIFIFIIPIPVRHVNAYVTLIGVLLFPIFFFYFVYLFLIPIDDYIPW